MGEHPYNCCGLFTFHVLTCDIACDTATTADSKQYICCGFLKHQEAPIVAEERGGAPEPQNHEEENEVGNLV